MAYYHDVEYHEDTIKKHEITEEEINFLKDLQKELNTQDHMCQADPRFWVIKGTVEELTKDYGYDVNGEMLFYNGEVIARNLEEAYNYLVDEVFDEMDIPITFVFDGISLEILMDGELDLSADSLGEISKWLNYHVADAYDWVNVVERGHVYADTMFLTQKGAEDHLKANYHHYSDDARTYAMTAWRSPEVEKLINILHSVDFDKLR